MKFKMKELSLKNYGFYMLFLEMTKMVTKTLENIEYDKGFKLYVTDLIDIIKDTALATEQASESNIPEYYEYVKKFSDILTAYSVKENDVPKIDDSGNISIIPELLDEYKNKMENLISEYSGTLKARQHEAECVKNYLEQEVTLTIPLVPFDLIPNAVTTEQMKYLRLLIDRGE